ncbi:MAPEG family protein [Sphingomonas sp.]|uniref:MAPEG family protein n=1 Tax=Sphingomonas sp. TaxID=28214 RepID=UPI0035BC3201
MILPITLTIAAALAITNIWLAIRIVRLRMQDKTLIGTGGAALLETRMRAQANLVEYAPFFLILLALLELAGAATTWLWIAGVAFVLARLAHPIGMDRGGTNPLRGGGAVATWVLLLLMSGWALATAYAARPAGGAVIAEPLDVRA